MPPQITCASALPGKTENNENRIFTQMLYQCIAWIQPAVWFRTVLHAQCTSALSSEFPILQGNAEVLERWGGKTTHLLISDFLSKRSAKSYPNRIVYV